MKLHIQTPLLESLELGEIFQGKVFLKMEALQPSGSFKNRGIGEICSYYATHDNAQSFVSSSGGNAGLAVAYSGRMLKIPVKVVIPQTTPSLMVEKIEREQAEVIIHGEDWMAADQLARKLAQVPGSFYISPFDHPLIWQGHATLIHEAAVQGEKPDAIVVAVGGGGLFCGVIQGLYDVGWEDIPVFSAETEGAASLAQSIQEGRKVTLNTIKTIARSLGARQVAEKAWEWTQRHPVFPLVVSDQQALNACLRFMDDHRMLVEPACGAALASIYDRLIDSDKYKKVLVVVCGGNGVTTSLLQEWKHNLYQE
jgi:L-serine/L-threonine ammonia-lyase